MTCRATRTLSVLLFAAICYPSLPLGFGTEELRAQEKAVTIFLVRHAEKADDGTSDPPLTSQGEARARCLAGMLDRSGIEVIYSTDFQRTRATAAPIAAALGLPTTEYDPRDLGAFASRLLAEGRSALVVGHSNTTPPLAEALVGHAVDPISDDEYDFLYVVTATGGRVALARLDHCVP